MTGVTKFVGFYI